MFDVCNRFEFCHTRENADKLVMFDSIVSRRRCQLAVLITCSMLCSTWFAHIILIRHQQLTPAERYNAKMKLNTNGLNSKPHSAKGHFITLDKIIYADGKLQKDNDIYANNSVDSDYGELSLPDKSSTFVKYFGDSNATFRVTSCNQECQRFRNSLLNWPKDKPKAAVYYLAKSDQLNKLKDSLISLYHSFLYRFDYPVIVFHEAGARDLIYNMVRKNVNIRLFLQEVYFNIPDHLNASTARSGITCRFPIGYRHMCRFHSKQIYEQAILVGLEYVFRIDDDSLFPATINYNLFIFMQVRRFQYGYMKAVVDDPDCTKYIWKAAEYYMKQKRIKSSPFFDKWDKQNVIYCNFEISALSFWKSKPYLDYINFIDFTGGIYYYRWGDTAIKTTAITMLMPENVVHLFTDVTYNHKFF